MSPAIIDLDAHRPHYTITTHDGKVHVVPARFFEDVAGGRRSIDDLADRDEILRVIVSEWLVATGLWESI